MALIIFVNSSFLSAIHNSRRKVRFWDPMMEGHLCTSKKVETFSNRNNSLRSNLIEHTSCATVLALTTAVIVSLEAESCAREDARADFFWTRGLPANSGVTG